jgi:hypothetical protein
VLHFLLKSFACLLLLLLKHGAFQLATRTYCRYPLVKLLHNATMHMCRLIAAVILEDYTAMGRSGAAACSAPSCSECRHLLFARLLSEQALERLTLGQLPLEPVLPLLMLF